MIEITFDDLLKLCSKNFKNNDSINNIKKAYEYALKQHSGRKRLTGDDYISHSTMYLFFSFISPSFHIYLL